jgi:hypothetical protein
VFSTKHISKSFKPGLGDTNVTVNYGDEDILYSGPLTPEIARNVSSGYVYMVHFVDGPIVLITENYLTNGHGMGGMNMPPWGGDYYDTAAKLYKEYLKGK